MPFKVTGRVYEAESGLGIANLVIEAFDKDLVKNDELGEAKTNSNGTFEITYIHSISRSHTNCWRTSDNHRFNRPRHIFTAVDFYECIFVG